MSWPSMPSAPTIWILTRRTLARGRRRTAHQELRWKHDSLARSRARQALLEQLERGGPEKLSVERDGGERGAQHAREVHVIEADHRQVFGDPDAALARSEVHARGDHVVVAEHSGGHLVEKEQPVHASVLDRDRSEHPRLRVRVETSLAQHAHAALLAMLEGERPEGGGEMA